jgi:hypothetical protein
MIPLALIGGIAVVWCCLRPHSLISVIVMVWCSLHYQKGQTSPSERAREIVKYEYENFG